jgi:predicted NACHT family NTPase
MLLVQRARQIYSFSHLTFQEYFTALAVINSFNPQDLERSVSRITKKSWREVFLLAAGMMQSANELLLSMKQKTDAILASDDKLQQFLTWVNQKSFSVQVPYQPLAIRTFYFAFTLNSNHCLAYVLGFSYDLADVLDLVDVLDLIGQLSYNLDLTHLLNLVRDLGNKLTCNLNLAHDLARDLARELDLAHTLAPELKRPLQQLKAQLPDPDQNLYRFGEWWIAKSQAWTEQLIAVMFESGNFDHNWQFSEQQKELLNQYYDANKLLVECLNSGCEASPEVRHEIEDTLLLPIAKIENYYRN